MNPGFRAAFWALRFWTCFMVIGSSAQLWAASYTTPRPLLAGDTYELTRDGWFTPAGGSAYDGDVTPKTDSNDAKSRDNPYFRRHNISRAWPTDIGYWYTAADQHDGEPDPAGEQWVDYVPPFEILGPGRYSISAAYRWSAGRASYPAVYRVNHAFGTNVVLVDQRVGPSTASVVFAPLGEYEMVPGSFVRAEDTGTESLTFSNMRLKLISPAPRLTALQTNNVLWLRWPTNALPYQLEVSAALGPEAWWEPLGVTPTLDGSENWVELPFDSEPKYFRLMARPE